MQDIMIDLETIGKTPNTTVISIGACFFDEELGVIGPTFYMALDVDAQLKHGRKVDGGTLRWWMGQTEAAKKVFNEKAANPKQVLELFAKWVLGQNTISKIRPWGNGSSFDISIIEDLFRMYEIKCPWLYYNVFDLRTFKRYIAGATKVDKSSGVDHNALDDALAQAKFVIQHYKGQKEMVEYFTQLAIQNQEAFGKPE